MTAVSALSGETLLIQIGNGGTPETFTHPCLINTDRGIDWSAATSSAEIADCGTPGNPAYMRRVVKSIDLKISGSGVMDAASVLSYMQTLNAGTIKNVRINQNVTGANGGWTISGQFVITAFSITGTARDTQTCSITLEAAGPLTITANA